jgi:7-cyano-7-deazaguanine tRNA-ribosyltransferase
MVQNTRSVKDVLLLLPEPDEHPFYGQYNELRKIIGNSVQFAYYSPFLGIVPEEISDVFPAAHHVAARIKFDPAEFETFGDALSSYIKKNAFKRIVAVADDFLESFLKELGDVTLASSTLTLPYTAKTMDIANAVNGTK